MAKLSGVGKETLATYEVMTLNPLPNGKVTASLPAPDGRVKSIQPNGDHEWRPAGTAGAYEQATVDGRYLIYNYRAADGVQRVHLVSLIPELPEFS